MSPHTKPPAGTQINPLHPLSQGLVGFWLFNEGAGSLANDISGNKNHGRLTNMAPNVQGSGWGGSEFGGSLEFDGSNDYNRMIGSSAVTSLNNFTEQTVSIRIKFDTLEDWFAIVSKWGNNNIARQFSIFSDSAGKLGYYISADDSSYVSKWSTNSLVSTGIWYHLVFTWTPSSMVIYVNGVEKETFTTSIPATMDSTSDRDFVIGCSGNTQIDYSDAVYNVDGSIDFVRIYNRALSAKEIAWSYREPYAMFKPALNPALLYSAAPPVGAIMNQFQGANLGADLYNGAIIT